MALTRRKKAVTVSDVPIQFKPFRSDYNEIANLAKAWGKGQPEVARELISEALKARRLKAVGHDETTHAVVLAQKGAMGEVIAPVRSEIKELREMVERVESRIASEFDHAGRQTKFLIRAVRFIVFEIIICRLLLRDYVHKVYKVFVDKSGQKVTEIERNFKVRLEAYRGEADAELDALTEASVVRLHALAAREGAFEE
jgi:hypothetical protein